MSNDPRILFLDIETRPMVAEVWGLRDQNIGLNQVREFGGTLCVGTLWSGQKRVQFFSDWQHGHIAMLEAIHGMWNEADAICGYNSDRFDIRKLKAEFVKEGMEPPKPVASIDVFKTVKREFFFDSHKLDHVAHLLGVGRKVSHEGHGLWMKVLQGDEKARRMMERYCKHDVRLLEQVYQKLLPWMTTHPRLTEDVFDACHKCGGRTTSQGWKPTVHFRVQSLKCTVCGGWQQGKREKIAA
jgi:DNA polymerase elongation subunit (family B)